MAKEENFRKANLSFRRLPMLGESHKGGLECSVCENLRRAAVGDDLVTVGAPRCACGDETAASEVPFAVVDNAARGRIALTCRGVVLQALYLDEEAVEEVGVLPGRVSEALQTAEGRVRITAGGVRMDVTVSDEGTVRLSAASAFVPPLLRFEAEVAGRVTETVTERALRGSYSAQSTRLTDVDAEQLSADVLSTYERLCRRAGRIGCFVQPVVVRYRLEGAGGVVLYRSAPVVAGSGGWQLTGEKSLRIGASLTLRESGTMAADAWRLRLRSSGSVGADASVERLVVEMSRPIHPVDFNGYAANALDAGASVPAVRFMMPGTSNGMVESTELVRSRLRAVAGRCREAMEDVAVVSAPFASGGVVEVVVQPVRLAIAGASEDAAALDRLGKTAPEKADERVVAVAAPHTWEAHCGAVAGDTQVWGDIEVTAAAPWPVEMLTSTTASGTWRGIVAVEMAGGEVVVRQSAGTGNVPTALSPLVYYPHPGARAVTVAITSGGVVRSGRYTLTPTADGLGAYMLAEGLGGWLPETASTMPDIAHTATTHRIREMLLTTSAGYGSEPVSAALAGGAVKALAAMDRRGGAWDYMRRRLYVMGSAGTAVATLDASGAVATLHRFDTRPVAGGGAVAVTTDDRYPLVVVAGGDVVGIGRSGIRTLVRGVGAGAKAGWDAVDGELWVVDGAGALTVRQGLDGGWYTLGGLKVRSMLTMATGLLVCDGERLLSTAAGREEAVEALYKGVVAIPGGERPGMARPMAVGVDFATDDQLSATLALGAFRWAVEGCVPRRRLMFRLLAPRMAAMPLTLALAPTSSLALQGLSICGIGPTGRR